MIGKEEDKVKEAFLMNSNRRSIYRIAYVGVMAAVVCVSNFISIPTAVSRLHVANAVCLLSGMLLGGVQGGLAAGLGSAAYDLLYPKYAAEAWITFINKGAMALLCGLIFYGVTHKQNVRVIRRYVAAVCGAALYIALYMLKTYIQKRYVAGMPMETLAPIMLEKLGTSAINGLFAVIVAPLLYRALYPALEKAGLYRQIDIK